MEKPNIKIGELIKIGKGSPSSFSAVVYSIDPENIFCDIEVVYLQDGYKPTKDEAIWDGEIWKLKDNSQGITLDNSDEFVQILKKDKK